MNIDLVIELLKQNYPGLNEIDTWGETSLFYNPKNLLKHDAYFLTFKKQDGSNDFASKLDRDITTYRMNFKITKTSFLNRFDEPTLPKRPNKGEITVLESGKAYDPAVVDTLIPHPVYAWMSWVSIINPSQASIVEFNESGLIDQAYADAVKRYCKAAQKQSL